MEIFYIPLLVMLLLSFYVLPILYFWALSRNAYRKLFRSDYSNKEDRELFLVALIIALWAGGITLFTIARGEPLDGTELDGYIYEYIPYITLLASITHIVAYIVKIIVSKQSVIKRTLIRALVVSAVGLASTALTYSLGLSSGISIFTASIGGLVFVSISLFSA